MICHVFMNISTDIMGCVCVCVIHLFGHSLSEAVVCSRVELSTGGFGLRLQSHLKHQHRFSFSPSDDSHTHTHTPGMTWRLGCVAAADKDTSVGDKGSGL